MKKETKEDRRRTRDVDRDLAGKLKADEPEGSLDRLTAMLRRVLHVSPHHQGRAKPS